VRRRLRLRLFYQQCAQQNFFRNLSGAHDISLGTNPAFIFRERQGKNAAGDSN
jgi:hypothetical protein